MVIRPDEPELLPGSLIVRGGDMTLEGLESSVRNCHKLHGVYGISVAAGRDETLDSLYQKSKRLRRVPQFRATTAGVLLALPKPFQVKLTPTAKPPHYTLDIGRPVDEEVWTLLDGVFGPVTLRPEWVNDEGNS